MNIYDILTDIDVQILDGPFIGGQKKVYKCLIKDKYNALKIIKSNYTEDESDVRCEREIKTLALCNSPYLIKLGEIPYTEKKIEDKHIVYYSEEWIDGDNLYDMLKAGKKFSEVDIIKIAKEISFAIEELWKHNKVHRDIKPLNIMFDHINNRYVLLDLGMVFDSTDETLTKYGYIPGTIGYFSPEQFDLSRKKELDFRSDLFCLGIVMYQLLCGEHPFNGSNQDEIIDNIIHLNPRPLSDIIKISPNLENIIFRLLRKHPSERFRNCQMFRDLLEGDD